MYLPGMGAIVDRHDAVFKFNLYNLGARPGKCAPEAAPWAQSYVHGTQYVGGQVLFVPSKRLGALALCRFWRCAAVGRAAYVEFIRRVAFPCLLASLEIPSSGFTTAGLTWLLLSACRLTDNATRYMGTKSDYRMFNKKRSEVADLMELSASRAERWMLWHSGSALVMARLLKRNPSTLLLSPDVIKVRSSPSLVL